jgi:hypothetical protein
MNMLIKRLSLVFGLLLAALVTGCAHPISVTADLAQIKGSGAPRIEKSVGYYISAADVQREVETPGGGGDKVKYFPYRDLEPAIYKSLSESFASVVKLDSPTDAAALAKNRIQLVILPTLVTNSSSSSALTWPPTKFSVELTCKVNDAAGKPVTEIKVTGNGEAEFSEFKSDFSMSAKRAAQDAAAKLVKALEASPELRR